jgi:hypothetical protein
MGSTGPCRGQSVVVGLADTSLSQPLLVLVASLGLNSSLIISFEPVKRLPQMLRWTARLVFSV